MTKKQIHRIVAMRKAGRSWTEISQNTNFPVKECQSVVWEYKKELRKELAKVRANSLEKQENFKPKPHLPPYSKDWPPFQTKYGRGKLGWKDQRFYTQEQLDRERERYLEHLLEELRELGR